jgi:hypothetical protein
MAGIIIGFKKYALMALGLLLGGASALCQEGEAMRINDPFASPVIQIDVN